MSDPYKVFGFSKKTEKVFLAVLSGQDTPVKISKETDISRPAIYAILKHLQARGLIVSQVSRGVKHWALASDRAIDETLYEAKRALLGISEGRQEIYRKSDVGITLYRGKDAIEKLLKHLFENHKGEYYRGTQGDNVFPAWQQLFGIETINEFNKNIKKNRLIVEAVLPEGYFEGAVSRFGVEWARHFEGRTYRVGLIDPSYFQHGAELFLFKDILYLASMSEALIIEIRHSEIQKMISLFFTHMQDTARSVDGNEMLRKLIAEKS